MAQSTKNKMTTRTKKIIRRTIGSLFIISALLVVFIPEKDTEAGTGTPLVTVEPQESSIPVIKPTDVIYTTGDGAFQFAYVEKASSNDKVAVIVGYDYERNLPSGELVIPDTVDAYVKATNALGSVDGYVAVGKSDNPLYYPTYKTIDQPTGDYDEDGNPITQPVEVIDSYRPCLYSEYNIWYYQKGSTTVPRAVDEFYYYDETADPDSRYKLTTEESHQRIQNATVTYISSQHADKTATGWELSTNEGVGIFSNATNIIKLTTGDNLLGIGNYAFYDCTSLEGISLGDGANTIGNYAFALCLNLKEAKFQLNSSIKAIGDHAFYNCRSMETFTMPVAVIKVGDSAFEGCYKMTSIDLKGAGQQVNLQLLGKDIFKDCTSLTALEFPLFFKQDIPLSYVYGCTSLDYISVPNTEMTLVEEAGVFEFEDFKQMVKEEFYFEGGSESLIHDTATAQCIAFKYLDQDLYEKVYSSVDGDVIYRVDSNNELKYFYMDSGVKDVEIPNAIGPFKITSIGSDSFQGNHYIQKIKIPSSIVSISDNAFKGCHRLKDVIFSEPIMLTSIGEGAFDTQVVDTMIDTCTLDSTPVLTFTGTIDKNSVPYNYAINEANNINRGSQAVSYITFYSGWPSNLTVSYNPETQKAELTDYPRLTELMSLASAGYPYLTTDQANAANAAYSKYSAGSTLTEDEQDIINSALNPVIPKGVEGIKSGVFSNKDELGKVVSTSASPDTKIQSVTVEDMNKIDGYTFADCSSLLGVYIKGNTTGIGDYAFLNCSSLVDVDITPELTSLGKCPFTGCTVLEDVDFGNGNNFECKNGLIFGKVNGVNTNLLECLESRGQTSGTGAIVADELSTVTAIAEDAFKNCDGVLSTDFSTSKIESIPIGCFEDTDDFYSITLPDTCKKIGKYAFKDSNVRYLEIPNSVNIIDPTTFENDTQTITFFCQLDSMAADYAEDYPNIVVQEKKITYKVTFYDEDTTTILDTVTVEAGQNAVSHVVPTKTGYVFKAWLPAPNNVTSNLNTYATYEEEVNTHTVTFIGYDDKVLYTQTVKDGEDAIEPAGPSRSGYTFTGWRPAITKITTDVITYAQYEKNVDKTSDSSNKPSGSSSSGNSQNNTKLYTLTVEQGSGGGSYAEGSIVIIIANTAPTGKTFDKWTTDNSAVTFTSATTATTTLKMPATALTVKATYKDDKTNTSTNTTTSGGSTNNTASTPNNSTTVTVTKPGISNSSAASATVSGSTDNYVVKITDSSTAKKEVEEALKEKFGSLDDVKYFAMDISLYDATGTNKVQPKDGVSVTITIPIPDDLIPYAGNNKVAYVLNGKVMDLSPKYTTINGVACVTFTATHFSPYTVYVDTSNLTAAQIQDATPKTGDFLSPKWFLVIGFMCIGMLFFLIRDKKGVVVKQKVAKS